MGVIEELAELARMPGTIDIRGGSYRRAYLSVATARDPHHPHRKEERWPTLSLVVDGEDGLDTEEEEINAWVFDDLDKLDEDVEMVPAPLDGCTAPAHPTTGG